MKGEGDGGEGMGGKGGGVGIEGGRGGGDREEGGWGLWRGREAGQKTRNPRAGKIIILFVYKGSVSQDFLLLKN